MLRVKSRDMFGKGMIAALFSAIIFVACIILTNKYDVFMTGFGTLTQILIAAVLIVFSIIVFSLALKNLPFSKQNKVLAMTGPYKFVRHPRYAAIVFLITPAISIILNSWLCLITIVPIYLIFRLFILKEEKHLNLLFGENYKKYRDRTPILIPGTKPTTKLFNKNF